MEKSHNNSLVSKTKSKSKNKYAKADERPTWNVNFSDQKVNQRLSAQSNMSKMGGKKTVIGFSKAVKPGQVVEENKIIIQLQQEVAKVKTDNELLHKLVANITKELKMVKGENTSILKKLKSMGITL